MAFPCTLVIFSTLLGVFNCLRFGQMIYIAVLAKNPMVIVALLAISGVGSLLSFSVKMVGILRIGSYVIWAFLASSLISIVLEFLTFAIMLTQSHHYGVTFNLDIQLASVLLVAQDALITAYLFRLGYVSRRKKCI